MIYGIITLDYSHNMLNRHDLNLRFLDKKFGEEQSIALGRKTFQDTKHTLWGKNVYVLTNSPRPGNSSFKFENGEMVCNNVFFVEKKTLPKNYWLLGGVSVYKQFLKSCESLYVIRHDSRGEVNFREFLDTFEQRNTTSTFEGLTIEIWTNRCLQEST